MVDYLTMAFEGYIIREKAAALNAYVNWSTHPCKPGKGDCCKDNVPTSHHDRGVISDGVRKGKIPAEIIQDAKARAQNQSEWCGFFNPGSRKCTIYEYRPALCMMTGAGGVLRANISNAEKYDRQIDQFDPSDQSRPDAGIPFSALSSSMCQSCHSELNKRGIRAHTGAVILYNDVLRYYAEDDIQPINSFIGSI